MCNIFRTPETLLTRHIRTHAVKTDGPYKLSSGGVSDWYIDVRETTFSGEGSLLVAETVYRLLRPEVNAVGGMTMGADPISVACVGHAAKQGSNLKAFSVRKKAKKHGTGGRLVGPVQAGDQVAIVDDVVTTGRSLTEVIQVAEKEGLQVKQVIALVDRSNGEASRVLSAYNLPYVSVLTPKCLGLHQEDTESA